MAETHEPSYYEIALTNRQVIVAFVILLVCLLSAFFSGVWIGRESTARAEERLVRNTPPRQAQAPKEGQNLEELDFFNKAPAKQGEPQGQQEAQATNTTLAQDLGSEPAAPPNQPEPAGQAAAAPAGDQAAANETAAERRERRRKRKEQRQAEKAAAAAAAAQGGATPAPAGAPPPATPARTPKASAPAVPKGSVVIQVFSSADQSQAESIRAKLAGGGYKAYLAPIERGGRTMYRVRLGPFASRGDAQAVADKVRKGYRLDTWVTE